MTAVASISSVDDLTTATAVSVAVMSLLLLGGREGGSGGGCCCSIMVALVLWSFLIFKRRSLVFSHARRSVLPPTTDGLSRFS